MAGKGSKQRPRLVDKQTFDSNYDRIYARSKTELQNGQHALAAAVVAFIVMSVMLVILLAALSAKPHIPYDIPCRGPGHVIIQDCGENDDA